MTQPFGCTIPPPPPLARASQSPRLMELNNKSKRFKPWQSSCRGGALLLKRRRLSSTSCSPNSAQWLGLFCASSVNTQTIYIWRRFANRFADCITTWHSMCVHNIQQKPSLSSGQTRTLALSTSLSEAVSGFRKRTEDYNILETPKIGQATKTTCTR